MEDNNYCCCFTGYRPQKFPFEINPENPEYIAFENRLCEKISELMENGCYTFITGMAMGFDIIAAETVLILKDAYKNAGISLICALPFIEQSKSFPSEWKKRYDSILENCDKAILISDKYYPACFTKRNIFMVDSSDYVLAFYDGKSGGTKMTVDYAKRKGRTVFNLSSEE